MRKLYHSYRDTATTATARTHSADFSNVGVVSHLIVSLKQVRSSGTGTAGVLANSLLDVSLEGYGKLIDNMTLQQCAGIADLESGAVVYHESASAGASGDAAECHFAIPIGLIDLTDDVLRVRLYQAATGLTLASQVVSIALASVSDRSEVGVFSYERQSFAFTAANQRLAKDLRAYGYDRIYASDFSGIISQFEVKPDNAPESYGFIEALTVFNYALTPQEAFTDQPSAWNKVYLLNNESGFASDAATYSVGIIATGSGTVEMITRRRTYRPEKVAMSMRKSMIKQANVRMIEQQQNPQAVRVKKIVKNLGSNSQLRKY